MKLPATRSVAENDRRFMAADVGSNGLTIFYRDGHPETYAFARHIEDT
jgi:hypothetical protein